ncbi:hypothetical protein [Isoalcanivorax indicus]|uniref:hypothetical protein n=1 Tax=Isoalcanivorax indicus TaxID=2202653 RepID=UPI0013C4DF0F|nr:hypothetical protein [Isoalcanivorax indicus]
MSTARWAAGWLLVGLLGAGVGLAGCGGSSGGGGTPPANGDPGPGGPGDDPGDDPGNDDEGDWVTLGAPIPVGVIQTSIGSRLVADGNGRIYSLSASMASPPRLNAWVYENDEDGWQDLEPGNIRVDDKAFNPAVAAGDDGFSMIYHRGWESRDIAVVHYSTEDGWGTPAVVVPSNVSHGKARAASVGDTRHLAMMDSDGALKIWSMEGSEAPGTPINGPAGIGGVMNWDLSATGSSVTLAWRAGSPAQLNVGGWSGSEWVTLNSVPAPDSLLAVALASTSSSQYLLRSTGAWAQGSALSADVTAIIADGAGSSPVVPLPPFTENIHTLPYYDIHVDSALLPWVVWVEYEDDPFDDDRARLYVARGVSGTEEAIEWELVGDGKVVPYDDSIPGAVSSALINDVPYVQFRDGGSNLRVMYYQTD